MCCLDSLNYLAKGCSSLRQPRGIPAIVEATNRGYFSLLATAPASDAMVVCPKLIGEGEFRRATTQVDGGYHGDRWLGVCSTAYPWGHGNFTLANPLSMTICNHAVEDMICHLSGGLW